MSAGEIMCGVMQIVLVSLFKVRYICIGDRWFTRSISETMEFHEEQYSSLGLYKLAFWKMRGVFPRILENYHGV